MEQFLHTIIKQAGTLGIEYFKKEFKVSEKSGAHDLLTEADTAVNSFLTTIIKETYPTHAITSEEEAFHAGESEYEWVIDPIEGTYNFAHGVPMWAVMISLLHNDEPQYSAIYWPISDQLFYANDSGAYINGKRLHIGDNTKTIEQATTCVFAGKPSGEYGREYERYVLARNAIGVAETAGTRHLGTSGALVFLLTGFIDLAFGNWGLDWDYIPTFHILRQGGVIVTDSRGNPWQRGRQDYVLSANQELQASLLAFFPE